MEIFHEFLRDCGVLREFFGEFFYRLSDSRAPVDRREIMKTKKKN